MRVHKSSGQRGFTLIEMSIVLVIIGLIVGGILKGQEIIESARQKNFASLTDQLKAGQNTFEDRYRALPGDYAESVTRINANVPNGDSDGYVSTAGGPYASLSAMIAVNGAAADEEMNYFNSLVAAGLFGGGQVVAGTTAVTTFSGGATASPLPPGPWPNSGLTVTHGTHEGSSAVTGSASLTAIWYRLTLFTTATIAATDAPLTASQAFFFDQKFDDGLPSTGRIRNSGVNVTPCGGIATNAYDIAGTSNTNARQCDLFVAAE